MNLAFSPFNLGFLAFVCFIPLMAGEEWPGGRRFFLGWLAGFLTQLGGYYWIFFTIRDFGGQGPLVSVTGTVLFCLFQGLDMALWIFLAPWIFGKSHWLVKVLGYGSTWYLIQALVFPYLFPWSLGATQTWFLPLMKTSIFWSQNGIGFFLVSIQVLGFYCWKAKGKLRSHFFGVTALIVGFVSPALIPGTQTSSHLKVAVVQPNLIPWAKQKHLSPEELLVAHEQPTRSLLGSDVDLVLWPETALAFPLNWYPGIQQRVQRLAQDLDATMVIGALSVDPERRLFNEIWMFQPQADVPEKYQKERLVLFSERLPLILRWARFFDSALGGYVPGMKNSSFECNGTQLVPLVCFEAILADYARKRTGHLFVNLTNDAWFGKSKASSLHLQHLRMRSVECQIPLVRATNSGISCWVDTQGRVHDPTTVYSADVRLYDVPIPQRSSVTLSRFGDGFIALASTLLVVWVILCQFLKSRLSRNSHQVL